MSGQPAPSTDALRASSDLIQDAISMFNVARRVIYKHCGWPYTSKGLGDRASRKEPLSYVALYSECAECNLRHVEMTEKVYMVWYSSLPFACRHKKRIDTLRVELNAERATQTPLAILPDRITALRPPANQCHHRGSRHPGEAKERHEEAQGEGWEG